MAGGHERNTRSVRLSENGGVGAGGLNESVHETLLKPNESPRSLNVEFDRESVASVGGALKLNNQAAPRSAVRCRPDEAFSPLLFRPGFSVPLRGAAYFPYNTDYDIGGDSASEGDFLALTETFHNRRGRSFQVDVSFRLPDETKLYEAPTKGASAPATPTATYDPTHGFDEALDDCTIILQKGGDRTAPMSWAIGVVNVGAGVDLTNSPPADRPSNYALVFMWLDSPGWGEPEADIMKYNLTTAQNPVSGAASAFCTQSYRAVLFHKFIEPGRDYNLALQLSLDSGSVGDTSTNTAWNEDGFLRLYTWTDRNDYESFSYLSSSDTFTGCQVLKGPTDSAEYLCKYGIRYFGADAMFAGLGPRNHPWTKPGFLPFGQDLTPMENGGFVMADRSATTVTGLYGAGVHTLTAAHTLGNAFVVVNHQGLSSGNTNGGLSPYGFGNWHGFGNGTVNFNTGALRNYRLVTTNDLTTGSMRGGVLNIETMDSAGLNLTITDGAAMGTWAATPVHVQAFRWNQRETVIGEIRIRRTPQDLETSDQILKRRRQLMVRTSIDLGDTTDIDASSLIAYWRCDDSEGSVLREYLVGGIRNGYLLPFGLGTSEGGSRGQLTFLSGEGEAPSIDLAEDPVIARELEQIMQDPRGGFALEITCVFTEAFYAIQDDTVSLPDSDTGAGALTGSRPLYVPDILTLEVGDPQDADHVLQPTATLALGFRGLLASTDTVPFLRPMAPSLEVGHRSDQEGEQAVQHQDIQPWYVTTGPTSVNRYSPNATWVGREVTIQVGFQPTRTVDDTYNVYIAVSPKDAFKPEDGDPADAELVYWTDGNGTYIPSGYLDSAGLVVQKKDLLRSVITIGRRNPSGINGYSELQPRMLVEEVRVFPMAAPGELPATSGSMLTTREGKIGGDRALPNRGLELDDFLFDLGASVKTVDLSGNSNSVTPTGAEGFTTGFPEERAEAIVGSLMYLPGDEQEIRKDQSLGSTTEEMYRIRAVSSGGSSLTLANVYGGGTRSGAAARALRLIAYTRFQDDLRDLLLSLGSGTPYDPATATYADAVVTQALWDDKTPIAADWKLRIFSPLGSNSLGNVFPAWDRGMSGSGPVGNPVLGVYGFDKKIYGTTQGALFEFDDRWRNPGPTDDLPYAFAVRGRCAATCLSLPLQNDRVVFTGNNSQLDPANSHTTYIDFWVKLVTNPELNAAQSGGHRIHYWVRFNRGVPEFVIGSSAQYGSTGSGPEKGLFIASGASPIEPGKWTHIRWSIETRDTTDRWQKPYLFIQGRRQTVRVNATDDSMGTPATTDWLDNTNVVTGDTMLLGTARDSFAAPDFNPSFVKDAVLGRLLRPQRYHGFMHALAGQTARVYVWEGTYLDGAIPSDFDPYQIDYTGVALNFTVLDETAYGVGHNIRDEANPAQGTIMSHPAISVTHELGIEADAASFAEYGERLYVTNGGIVGTVGPSGGSRAGVLAPTTAPGFRIDRFPLWAPNDRSGNFFNDPIAGADVGDADQINHFDVHGNNYLTEAVALGATGAGEIRWTSDSSEKRYFGFKGYFKLRETVGRIPLHDRRASAQSGPIFVEVVDGKVRVGWYDVFQKRDVYVETSREIVEPGLWYYIYVRKRWPQGDEVEGNWVNQLWSDQRLRRVTVAASHTFVQGETVTGGTSGTMVVTKVYAAASTTTVEGILTSYPTDLVGNLTGSSSGAVGTNPATYRHPMNDMLVVRRLRGNASVPPAFEGWDALIHASERNCISFTTDDLPRPAGTNANGQVTPTGITYTGAAGGIVNALAGSNPFHEDMVSAWWVWGTGAGKPFEGRGYKIVEYLSRTQIRVQEPGVVGFPDLSSIGSAQPGAVFMGCELVKSTGFDTSRQPDESDNSLRFFGTNLAVNPLNGLSRFDGEFDSFGITCIRDDDGEDARVFENVSSVAIGGTADAATVGTDFFPTNIYSGAGPGQLRFDNWVTGGPGTNVGTWLSVHGQTYAGGGTGVSTQPNADVEVAKDATPGPVPSTDAPDLLFQYLEAVATFAQTRFVRARFFDPDQNARSQPGPELQILPAGDDGVNPSGQIRYILTDLPSPRQNGDLEVELYMSTAGGSSTGLFLVATVPAGTKEVAVDPLEATIGEGRAVDFGSIAPPRCRVIAASNGRMFYGAPEELRDGALYSRLGLPVQIELGAIGTTVGRFRLSGGDGDAVTMLKEHDGFLVAAKRRALAGVTITPSSGEADVEIISTGVGCVANQSALAIDRWLIFMGDKGLYAAQRGSVTNLAQPLWIGERVELLTQDRLDRTRIARASAAYNRRRDEYVLAVQANDTDRQWQRVTLEVMNQSVRFGLQENPRVRSLGVVEDLGGGIERLIGGTEEGYVVWLDRRDTPYAMMGVQAEMFGKVTVQSAEAGTAYGIRITQGNQELDQTLDAARGAPIVYKDSTGAIRRPTVLWSEGNYVLFDEKQTGLIAITQLLAIGQARRTWETPWMSLGDPEIMKRLHYLDFVFKEEATGKLRGEVQTARDDFQETLDQTFEIDLTKGRHRQPMRSVLGHWLKVRVVDLEAQAGPGFELTDLILRVSDIGNP